MSEWVSQWVSESVSASLTYPWYRAGPFRPAKQFTVFYTWNTHCCFHCIILPVIDDSIVDYTCCRKMRLFLVCLRGYVSDVDRGGMKFEEGSMCLLQIPRRPAIVCKSSPSIKKNNIISIYVDSIILSNQLPKQIFFKFKSKL